MRLKLKGKDSQNMKSIVFFKKKNLTRVKFQVFLQNLGKWWYRGEINLQ